jgi:hypothetical protein
MMATHNGKIILGLALVFLLASVGPGFAQATKTFTGKITEIAKGTELGLGKKDIFYTLQLDEYPNIKFRLSTEDAVRFGVIKDAGPTGVVTPKHSKGLGWKVKLACDPKNLGQIKTPVYQVTSLVRLAN